MAEGPRSLTDTILDWVTSRIACSKSLQTSRPRWPPTAECRRALELGDVAAAVMLPDATDARYVIVDHLRRDAPHVLLTRDEEIGRDVVIKLIRAPTSVARAVCAREARLTAALCHPNVVTIHEVDFDGACLVLELLDADLRDLRGVNPTLLVDAYCQAGRGLAAAHAHGIWHLDFKPENVLVHVEKDRSGKVTKLWAKVTDFGIAEVVGPPLGDDPAPDRTGQRAGGDLEDQRAFATAVWESLTGGRRPPDGSELLTPQLHAVLSRALMADPSQRWADMTALVDAMERGRGGTAVVSGPVPKTSRLIELAIAQAEDGMFSSVSKLWRDAQVALAGRHAELGKGAFALGATLLDAAAEATGPAQRRGFARSIEVLEDAIRYLEAAGDLEMARYANSLAAAACDHFKELHPSNSPEHDDLERRASAFRARSQSAAEDDL